MRIGTGQALLCSALDGVAPPDGDGFGSTVLPSSTTMMRASSSRSAAIKVGRFPPRCTSAEWSNHAAPGAVEPVARLRSPRFASPIFRSPTANRARQTGSEPDDTGYGGEWRHGSTIIPERCAGCTSPESHPRGCP